MIQETLNFPPTLPVADPDVEQYWVYLIECQTTKHWYVGMTMNIGHRLDTHSMGRGAQFTREHGVKRIVHIWGPFKNSVVARRAENEKRVAAAQFFGNGAIVSNGVISQNVNGKIITGREETTLGRHDILPEASRNIYEHLGTTPSLVATQK